MTDSEDFAVRKPPLQPLHTNAQQPPRTRAHSKGWNEDTGRDLDSECHNCEGGFDDHRYEDCAYDGPGTLEIAGIQNTEI